MLLPKSKTWMYISYYGICWFGFSLSITFEVGPKTSMLLHPPPWPTHSTHCPGCDSKSAIRASTRPTHGIGSQAQEVHGRLVGFVLRRLKVRLATIYNWKKGKEHTFILNKWFSFSPSPSRIKSIKVMGHARNHRLQHCAGINSTQRTQGHCDGYRSWGGRECKWQSGERKQAHQRVEAVP